MKRALTCQFVRPDRRLFEGTVDHLILVAVSGELGIWPGHAPEICALGDGLVRLYNQKGAADDHIDVLVSGGYVEIDNDVVIILADHARRTDDIEPDVVQQTRAQALDDYAALEAGNPRRAYLERKVKWCDLLLAYAGTTK